MRQSNHRMHAKKKREKYQHPLVALLLVIVHHWRRQVRWTHVLGSRVVWARRLGGGNNLTLLIGNGQQRNTFSPLFGSTALLALSHVVLLALAIGVALKRLWYFLAKINSDKRLG